MILSSVPSTHTITVWQLRIQACSCLLVVPLSHKDRSRVQEAIRGILREARSSTGKLATRLRKKLSSVVRNLDAGREAEARRELEKAGRDLVRQMNRLRRGGG